MALDAVLFDLDGTLVDSNALHTRAFFEVMGEHGYKVAEDRIAVEIGKGGSMLVPAVLGEEADRRDGESIRKDKEARFLELVDREGLRVYDGVRDLFEALRGRGLKTAIATASKQEGLDKVIEATGLDLYALADAVVTDSDVDRSKPYPDVVQAAAAKLGVAPAQCAMVGDTPYDLLSAFHAGVTGIGLLTGVHDEVVLYQTGARAVYRDAAALLGALDEALERASPVAVHLDAALLERLMAEALGAARQALARGDLPVGCVLARGDGTVLATGHSRTETTGNFLLHGEMGVLHEAAEDVGRHARDLLLVSTLEPCVMCYGAAMEARVETVVYALAAPANGGPKRCTPMESPGMIMPRVVGGVCADESRALFEAWLDRHPGSAFVRDLLARLDRADGEEDV